MIKKIVLPGGGGGNEEVFIKGEDSREGEEIKIDISLGVVVSPIHFFSSRCRSWDKLKLWENFFVGKWSTYSLLSPLLLTRTVRHKTHFRPRKNCPRHSSLTANPPLATLSACPCCTEKSPENHTFLSNRRPKLRLGAQRPIMTYMLVTSVS